MHPSMTRDRATVVAHRIVSESTGNVSYVSLLADRAEGALRVRCPHHRGHRTVEAAIRCGEKMRRQLPN